IMTFQYDGLGRMRISTNWDGTTTEYVYDGMRVIQERDGSNTPQVSYTRGPDLSGTLEDAGGIGGLLARSAGYSSGNWTSNSYYHADGNGNIMYLEDSSQGLAASYRYDAFGETLQWNGPLALANTYQFSSKQRVQIDPQGVFQFEGIYYYGYRFYAPHLQRWLNRDPLGDKAFQRTWGYAVSRKRIDRMLYTLVENNPITGFDGFGLDKTPFPLNGAVCNCKENKKPVYVLIDGEYYTLPPGQCTAKGSLYDPESRDDADGFWIGDTFYRVGCGKADACHPPENPCVNGKTSKCEDCKWDGDPDSEYSPSKRSGKPSNSPPSTPPPLYQRPPTLPGWTGPPFI